MSRVAIIVGHARTGTFCEALGVAYRDGAAAAGHDAQLFVTSRMTFDLILRDGFERVQPLEPDLAAAHKSFFAADHILIIFPLWLGTLPAILKAFLERVLQPALVEPAKLGRFTTPLAGKSARVIITMGMPAFVYRWWFGAHALKMLKRNILGFVGIAPVRATIFGSIRSADRRRLEAWLARVRVLGTRLA